MARAKEEIEKEYGQACSALGDLDRRMARLKDSITMIRTLQVNLDKEFQELEKEKPDEARPQADQ